jgi:hypothetical protein
MLVQPRLDRVIYQEAAAALRTHGLMINREKSDLGAPDWR